MDDIVKILERARKCEAEISPQLEHIERLHNIARIIRGNHTKCKEYLDEIAMLETEVNAQIDKAVDAKREALVYINRLTGEERGVLERYFILAKNWDQVAADMYMSKRRVYMLRKKALEKLIQKEVKK